MVAAGNDIGEFDGEVGVEGEGEGEAEDVNACVWTLVLITSSGKMEAHVITPAIPPAKNTFAAAIFCDSSSPALERIRLQISYDQK